MGRCKRCQGRGTLVGFKPELDVPDGLRQIAPDASLQTELQTNHAAQHGIPPLKCAGGSDEISEKRTSVWERFMGASRHAASMRRDAEDRGMLGD